MAYGTIKVDQVTFTNGGVDQTISVSGIVQSISGDITATGTIQGATIIGTSTVSGATVTGDAGQFITATAATGVFTSTLSGATITGNTASFTTITGGTVTLTSGVFASGTAAAPSVSVGTTDNGLYSPGADEVAISTNGSERLRITSDGKVGIGTTTPGSYNASADDLVVSSSGNTGISIVSGTSSYGGLNFADGTTGDDAFRGFIQYQHNSDALLFGANAAERLRITSDGKVGLGTSSPQALLDVNGQARFGGNKVTLDTNGSIGGTISNSTTRAFVLSNVDVNADYFGGRVIQVGPDGTINIGGTAGTSPSSYSSPNIKLNPAGSSYFTGGSVGIGTTSPTESFTLGSGNAQITSGQLTVGVTSTSGLQFINDGTFGTLNNIPLILRTASTERVRLDTSGRVGIGTTSPKSTAGGLDVSSGGNSIIFGADSTSTSRTDATSKFARLGAVHYTNAEEPICVATVRAESTTNRLLFGGGTGDFNAATSIEFFTASNTTTTDGTERLRIDSSGRLLVGTSSAREVNGANSRLVQIEGTSTTTTNLSVVRNSNDDAGPVIAFGKTRSASNGGSALVAADDVLGGIGFAGGDGVDLRSIGAQILAYVDGTPGADDMPGRLVFSTTADGASSPTEHVRINNAGTTTVWSTSAPMLWGRNETNGSIVGLAYYNTATSTASLTGQVFRVMCDGDVENTNNSYGAISDITLKENIVDANSQWEDLKALQVRNYNFKPETGYSTHTQIGLVAQEVELVSPGLVGESIDEETGEATKSVNYSVLYMKAVKALQEAMERIEVLEAKVNALEGN
jgi:hypothetical protein